MKQTRIISFANHKGGVGKTTTTVSVGSILAHQGKKVMMIDLDAQANLTTSLTKEQPDETIYHALTGRLPGLPIIHLTDNLDLVPASEMLAMVDIELSGAISREKILSGLLEDVKELYDYILLDCPPSLGLITLNAITASTDVIVPLIAEVLPFKGLKMINNFVNLIHTRLNKSAHVTGILITRWESTLVFQTKIRKNVSVAEAPFEHHNIVEYAPKSNGAADYQSFVTELVKKLEG